MTDADLASVSALSARIHPDFPERAEILAEKLHLFPRGCFVLDNATAGAGGYCFSHPWDGKAPPALDTPLRTLPNVSRGYFVHDLALDPGIRGRDFGSALFPELIAVARSIQADHLTLVAVSGSQPFWMRMGFAATEDPELQRSTRAKYGAQSVHMTRNLR